MAKFINLKFNLVCAGNANKGPCSDDGGAAIFIQDIVGGKQKYVVAGLVGYSVGCARAGRFLTSTFYSL